MSSKVTIDEAELKDLRDYKIMLSQINCYIEDFCNEEETTLMGVIRLLAEYHQLKSDNLYGKLEHLKEELDK